jgi:hypothetical protein
MRSSWSYSRLARRSSSEDSYLNIRRRENITYFTVMMTVIAREGGQEQESREG